MSTTNADTESRDLLASGTILNPSISLQENPRSVSHFSNDPFFWLCMCMYFPSLSELLVCKSKLTYTEVEYVV
jgi:hypothetical protein